MSQKDLAMSVDDQMLTCLEIMCAGEDMLAIGVWEAPIKRLAMKEYAVKVGNGYRVTEAGKAVFAKSEGVEIEQVKALAPPRPDWIVTSLPDVGLVVLRKNEMTVSGYEALRPVTFAPVTHGRSNDLDTVAFLGDTDSLLQAMLDAAWSRGLRPTNE